MHVLVPVDGSVNCLRALRYVLEHRDVFGAPPQLTLINVHLPVPSSLAKAWLGSDVVDQYYAEEALTALAPAREILLKHHASATEIWTVGEPGVEISNAAQTHGCQMIVMGTHGRTALGNLVMGSVATRVVAETQIPVLLIK